MGDGAVSVFSVAINLSRPKAGSLRRHGKTPFQMDGPLLVSWSRSNNAYDIGWITVRGLETLATGPDLWRFSIILWVQGIFGIGA